MKKLLCLLFVMLLLVGCGAPATQPTTESTETTAPAEPDYSQYMCPWTAEDLAKARSDGKMHYFFMAAEGLHISRNQQNVDKWGDSTLIVFPDGKLMLVEAAKAAGTPIISCMGAGNKLDAAAFEVADISKTSICPLARIMRKELGRRGIKHLKVVYSKELAMTPLAAEEEADAAHPKRQTPGSNAFVPAVAGLILAGEVIKDLSGVGSK